MPEQKFDFLSEYIEEMLKHLDLGDMTPDEKEQYIPRIVAQAESRLGAGLLPLISPESGDKFADLLENDGTSQKEWLDFWHSAVPDFDEQIKKILGDFAIECARILHPLSI